MRWVLPVLTAALVLHGVVGLQRAAEAASTVAADPQYADDPDAARRLTEDMRAAATACDRAEYDRLGQQMQALTAMERSNPASGQPRLAALEWALTHQPFYPSRCALEAAAAKGGTQCPDGGGLLAGAINDLLGTNLAGVCQGKQIHGHDQKGTRNTDDMD